MRASARRSAGVQGEPSSCTNAPLLKRSRRNVKRSLMLRSKTSVRSGCSRSTWPMGPSSVPAVDMASACALTSSGESSAVSTSP
ncbi:MAG: hypothetical protein IPG81_17165 [Sandaracinaceae bacterium]|nr:hypothetical protein [Sandaracinaceae bacterium]